MIGTETQPQPQAPNNKTTFDTVVLRESISARTAVAPLSLISSVVPAALMVPFLIQQTIDRDRIVLWMLPVIFAIASRSIISARISKRLSTMTPLMLCSTDLTLRVSSIINQALLGSGIWIIQSNTATAIVPLFVTLIIILFSLGVMANLFSDFSSFVISAPLLIGQPAIYWLLQDGYGAATSIALLGALSLMIALIHRTSSIFSEAVLIRFEKNLLLEDLQQEQAKTQLALEEVEAANKSKAYFLASASHDIKQPLHALGLINDTLLMQSINTPHTPMLEMQQRSINQMKENFDGLMDFTKYDQGIFSVNEEIINLAELMEQISEEYSILCRQKQLYWHCKPLTGLIKSDKLLLARLLKNLLKNAIEYTEKGRVSFSAELKNNIVYISIEDTGFGIAAENQARIFDQFVQLTNEEKGCELVKTNSTSSSGSGLGLSIVSKLNDALNLNLTLASTLGKGTCFTICLPLQPKPSSM